MIADRRHGSRVRTTGYSYVEVLVATVLISVSLIPASEALRDAASVSNINNDYSAQHYRLVGKMEEVLANNFGALQTAAVTAGSETVATSFSDAVATTNRRLVFISPYDADNVDGDDDPFTGGDPDLLWVSVQLEGSALSFESLTTR